MGFFLQYHSFLLFFPFISSGQIRIFSPDDPPDDDDSDAEFCGPSRPPLGNKSVCLLLLCPLWVKACSPGHTPQLSELSVLNSEGARCSSVVRVFAHGAIGRWIDPSWGGPIELFSVPASAPRLV